MQRDNAGLHWLCWACLAVFALLFVVVNLGSYKSPVSIEFLYATNVAAVPKRDSHVVERPSSFVTLISQTQSQYVFKITNRTRRPVAVRFDTYAFQDPKGDETLLLRGASFGPPEEEFWNKRRFEPGEARIVSLPELPFDCSFRARLLYSVPLSIPQFAMEWIGRKWKRVPARMASDESALIPESPRCYLFTAQSDWVSNVVSRSGVAALHEKEDLSQRRYDATKTEPQAGVQP